MPVKVEKATESVELGEGPHWDDQQQALFFVSIHEKTIHKFVLSTGKHTKTTLDGRVGFIVPVEGTSDQFVVGMEHKFLVIQWDGGDESKVKVVRELGEVDKHEPKNRINDGKADPRGRLFAGTVSYVDTPASFPPIGSLFRLDKAKQCKIEQICDKIMISNGLAWDLKEKAFYYTDTMEFKIRRYDYDVETGEISNKKIIFDLKENNIEGMPDGSTIDTDGNLWFAVFYGSCVIKINPRTGELLEKVSIPAKQVTSVTFGGPNLDILFVTTANISIQGDEHKPPSGSIFMVTGLGVKGFPNVKFKC